MARRPVMSWINLGEVSYILERAAGESAARGAVRELRARLRLDLPTERRVLQAVAIKARFAMAYADAFAVATAQAHNAVLLSGDPEIISADPSWAIEDLRA